MEALKRRMSVAAVVRERIKRKVESGKTNTEKMMKRRERLARENDKYMEGKSLSKLLIKMRYEQ